MPVTITSFTADSNDLDYGDSTVLIPVFSGGTGAILEGELDKNRSLRSLPVLSGSETTITPSKSMTYTLMVTSLDGTDFATASTDVEVTVKDAKKLMVTDGDGVVVGDTYYSNSPVYMVSVQVDPASMSEHIAQVNEDTIKYQLIINNSMGQQPISVIGLTNLTSILAVWGLEWDVQTPD